MGTDKNRIRSHPIAALLGALQNCKEKQPIWCASTEYQAAWNDSSPAGGYPNPSIPIARVIVDNQKTDGDTPLAGFVLGLTVRSLALKFSSMPVSQDLYRIATPAWRE